MLASRQASVRFARITPDQRPFCEQCDEPMFAGSTCGRITYYYCASCRISEKVIRRVAKPKVVKICSQCKRPLK